MGAHGIEPFDLVVVNVYPFGIDVADFAHGGSGAEDVIDIGGPAMVRAAAKNHASGGRGRRPGRLRPVVLDELRANGRGQRRTRRPAGGQGVRPHGGLRRRRGGLVRRPAGPPAPRRRRRPAAPRPPRLPARAARPALRREPAPAGALYGRPAARALRSAPSSRGGRHDPARRAGPQLPQPLRRRRRLAAGPRPRRRASAGRRGVIVKHANPCGAAVADTLAEAYQLAFECDERSAFGGIVAVSGAVD